VVFKVDMIGVGVGGGLRKPTAQLGQFQQPIRRSVNRYPSLAGPQLKRSIREVWRNEPNWLIRLLAHPRIVAGGENDVGRWCLRTVVLEIIGSRPAR
jgi:hypothetical protein